MKTVSISEIQKNIGLIKKIKETILIKDKRKNKNIAVIFPIEENIDYKLEWRFKEKIKNKWNYDKDKILWDYFIEKYE